MRFRNLNSEEREKEKFRALSEETEQASERRGEFPTLGQSERERKDGEKAALPLEWKSLASFIEIERTKRPTREYLEGFSKRLIPRLKESVRADEAVRLYLRRTFWPRWSVRVLAAATIALMLLWIQIQQSEMRGMQSRLINLEDEVRVLKAGM